MRYIAAYLLLQLGGTPEPSAADIARVLSSVGIAADEGRLRRLLSSLQGKDIAQLIREGSSKLAAIPQMSEQVAQKPLPPNDTRGGAEVQSSDSEESEEGGCWVFD
ncbi:60S acidic ribosomal protein P2 [Peniophora sp. CONT]|nr:60S acidic ribosomal protein P2 [Peniophora sp. CONT]